MKSQESLCCLQSEKIEKNSTTSVIENRLNLMLRTLTRTCGKLISRKLVLQDAASC